MDYIISTKDRNYRVNGGVYYKDNPVAVKMRDDSRVFYNGMEISKKNPCFKYLKSGRYNGRFAGLVGTAVTTIGRLSRRFG
tara:strand:+ start:1915 stop:2157 length:243 start_codon:yes stop_codon:yes gene_type:complete